MQGYRSILSGSFIAAGAIALSACASHPPPSSPPSQPPPGASAPAAETMPAPAAHTAPLPVKKTAPVRYVVKKGDTLWSIATHFFSSPWLWPEVWYENHYIENPHLIYPGDVITLQGGALTVSRNGTIVKSTLPFRQLRPQVQRTPLGKAVPTIPYDQIADLLSKPRVMSAKAYSKAPYVLRPVDNELLAAAPNSVYVRGTRLKGANAGATYAVVRRQKPLYDPKSGDLLGYEVLYLGRGRLTATGDPATLKLTRSTQEIMPGNRLVPVDTGTVPAQFPLISPKSSIKGQIIDVIGGLGQVGQYQVVVLDRGERDHLEMGNVLEIERTGMRIHDAYAQGGMKQQVKLPNRKIGELVVFRAFRKVSFALVMHATHPVGIGDTVTNP